MNPAKMAEPIVIRFEVLTRVGSRNHVLDGRPDVPWEGAILRGRGKRWPRWQGHQPDNMKSSVHHSRQIIMPAPRYSFLYRPDNLPDGQTIVSKH